MKKWVQNISVLLMAGLILFGIGGLNIYHYCCDACEEYGHNIFTTISCEEVHAHHHCSDHHCSDSHCNHNHSLVNDNKNDICSHLTAHAKHCDVHHIEVFSELSSYSQDFSIDAPQPTMLLYIVENKFDIEASIDDYPLFTLSNAPPIFDGRAIIVRKNSYLI
ncbi:MAG: hypothetical protein ACI3ZZ_01195 [Candidatus Aphodosoma sp.]